MGTANIEAFQRRVEELESRSSGAVKAEYARLGNDLLRETSGINRYTNAPAMLTLDEKLGSDPQFRRNLYSLADNPDDLRRILPQILADRGNMGSIVANAAAAQARQDRAAQQSAENQRPRPAAQPQAAAAEPERPARTAPRVTSQNRPEPAANRPEPAAVAAAPSAAGATPNAPAATAQAAPAGTGGSLADKMAQVAAIDGYPELMQRVEANPQLRDMFTAMTGGRNAEGAEEALDGILNQARRDPAIFRNLIQTIDEKPGVVSSIASSMANDPRTGMMMIGMYSQFQQGIGSLLDRFLGPGFMDGIIQNVMGMVGRLFGESGGLMSMSNNGGALTRGMQAATGNNAAVTNVDPATGAAGAPQTRAEAMAEQERRLQQQGQLNPNRPGSTPPGMQAPAPAS